MKERMFPILGEDRRHRSGIAWSIVAKHERQADRNHSQTLEGLASRGGLSLCELAAVLEDRPWRSMSADEALAAIQAVESSSI